MDEKPDQIIGHIEAQRDQLGRNLNELETRVRETANWRTWFDRNPVMVMGAALGGGLLVGSMLGGKTGSIRRRRSRSGSHRISGDIVGSSTAGVTASETRPSRPASSQFVGEHRSGTTRHAAATRVKSAVSSLTHSESWHQVSDTLDDVKAALIAFGVVKAKEFLNQTIPGFEGHLNDAQQKRQGRTGGAAWQSSSENRGDNGHTGRVDETHQHQSGETGHHLYTPAGEQILRSGSYSSDPVGTYRP
jgi:hypothetical protein